MFPEEDKKRIHPTWASVDESDRLIKIETDKLEAVIPKKKPKQWMTGIEKRWFGWGYTEAVKWRLKFNLRLDKARAEIRLGEEEEQEWLVEHNKGSVEGAHKNIARLRGEIYFRQERGKNLMMNLSKRARFFDYGQAMHKLPLYVGTFSRRDWEKAKRLC